MSTWFQNHQKQALVILLLFIAAIVYFRLGGDDLSPESQVRAAIDEMIAGAENKDLDPFRKHLSERVRDEQGRKKDELLNMLRLIFLRHPKISLNLLSLDVADNTNPDIMSASLTLLMSETAIPTDKGNFFLTFRREGELWRVWEVRWQDGYGF